jgi:hypothetical protein
MTDEDPIIIQMNIAHYGAMPASTAISSTPFPSLHSCRPCRSADGERADTGMTTPYESWG